MLFFKSSQLCAASSLALYVIFKVLPYNFFITPGVLCTVSGFTGQGTFGGTREWSMLQRKAEISEGESRGGSYQCINT